MNYIKKFNFSIPVFIFMSLFFSLEISKMQVVKMNNLEQNNFFKSNSIVFHLQSNKITQADFFNILNSQNDLMFQKKYITDGYINGQAIYFSVNPKERPNIINGRYFEKNDFHGNTPVAVIGKDIKDKTITENGQRYLFVNNTKYLVIGIMSGKDSVFNNEFLINYNSYILNHNSNIDPKDFYQIQWKSGTQNKFLQLKQKLKNMDSNMVLSKDNSRTIINPIKDYIANRMSYLITIITIFILNIISISSYYIDEKRKEIGVLKAFGIRNITIIKKIIFQYEIISFFSFVIGIIIHFSLYKLMYENVAYYKIQLENVIGLIFSSLVTGFVASIWPTMKLLKVEPNEIMRR